MVISPLGLRRGNAAVALHPATVYLAFHTYALYKDGTMNERIQIDPLVCHGKPGIRGTRVLVSTVLGVQALGKEMDGRIWWIVANEYFVPVTYALRGLDTLEGVSYIDTDTGHKAVVRQGALTLSIPRYGVHLLRPSDF